MSKKIKYPNELNMDSVIYMKTAKPLEGTTLMEYDVKPIEIMVLRKDGDKLHVEGVSGGVTEHVPLKKDYHSPGDNDIYLNEDEAFKAVKEAWKETRDKAEAILEIAKAGIKFWENKDTIAPASPREAKKITANIRKNETEISIEDQQ